MSDELRDRIAAVIYRQLDRWNGSSSVDIAQAVIDDLGLTVETFSGLAGLTIDEPKSRVVGRWEQA